MAVFRQICLFDITTEQEERLIAGNTEQQLFIRLRQRQLGELETRATLIIQKFSRMMIQRLRWIKLRNSRLDAVLRIQRSYRGYRRWKIIPKLVKRRRENMRIMIQKYMKGYLLRKWF